MLSKKYISAFAFVSLFSAISQANATTHLLCEGDYFQGEGPVEAEVRSYRGFTELSKIVIKTNGEKVTQMNGFDHFTSDECRLIQNDAALLCDEKQLNEDAYNKYETSLLLNRWTGLFSGTHKSWFENSKKAYGFKFNGYCSPVNGPLF